MKKNEQEIFEEIKNSCSSYGEGRRIANTIKDVSESEQERFIEKVDNRRNVTP